MLVGAAVGAVKSDLVAVGGVGVAAALRLEDLQVGAVAGSEQVVEELFALSRPASSDRAAVPRASPFLCLPRAGARALMSSPCSTLSMIHIVLALTFSGPSERRFARWFPRWSGMQMLTEPDCAVKGRENKTSRPKPEVAVEYFARPAPVSGTWPGVDSHGGERDSDAGPGEPG